MTGYDTWKGKRRPWKKASRSSQAKKKGGLGTVKMDGKKTVEKKNNTNPDKLKYFHFGKKLPRAFSGREAGDRLLKDPRASGNFDQRLWKKRRGKGGGGITEYTTKNLFVIEKNGRKSKGDQSAKKAGKRRKSQTQQQWGANKNGERNSHWWGQGGEPNRLKTVHLLKGQITHGGERKPITFLSASRNKPKKKEKGHW